MRKCDIKDCNEKHYARGYCCKHYRSKFYDQLSNRKKRDIDKRNGVCSLDGCDKAKFAKNYCRSHYDKFLRCGNPLGVDKANCNGCGRRILKKTYDKNRGFCYGCYIKYLNSLNPKYKNDGGKWGYKDYRKIRERGELV